MISGWIMGWGGWTPPLCSSQPPSLIYSVIAIDFYCLTVVQKERKRESWIGEKKKEDEVWVPTWGTPSLLPNPLISPFITCGNAWIFFGRLIFWLGLIDQSCMYGSLIYLPRVITFPPSDLMLIRSQGWRWVIPVDSFPWLAWALALWAIILGPICYPRPTFCFQRLY